MAFVNGSGGTFTGITSVIDKMSWSGASRAAVETTHLGTTGGKTFVIGGMYDPGEIQATGAFDASELVALMTAAAASKTATFVGGGAITCSMFATNVDVTAGIDEKVVATVTFKLTGSGV